MKRLLLFLGLVVTVVLLLLVPRPVATHAQGQGISGQGVNGGNATADWPVLTAIFDGTLRHSLAGDTSGNAFSKPPAGQSQFQTLSTNTTTQIIAAPAAGLRFYVTGVTFNTRTAGTATTVQVVYGTGTNCATGTTGLSPTFANTAAGVVSLNLGTGLVPPAANAICAAQAGTTAGTTDVLVSGYTAP